MKRLFPALLLLSLVLAGCAQVRAAQTDTPAQEDAVPQLIFAEDAFEKGHNAPDAVCYERLEARWVQFDVEDIKSMLFTEAGDLSTPI